MSQRKLSEILIEIALQGLKSPKYAHSDVMHPLMMLAHIAWNRVTQSPDYQEDYHVALAQFKIPKKKLRKELISEHWPTVLRRMIDYKKANFPDDKRVVTKCAYTPWETFRVEWAPGASKK